MNMDLNPLNKIRHRLNQGVSDRVAAQLQWRDAEISARIDALERSIAALQNNSKALSTSVSDRLRTLEVATEDLLRDSRTH
jgi:predicted  nucleic acid-binding Zn-ribbon protein